MTIEQQAPRLLTCVPQHRRHEIGVVMVIFVEKAEPLARCRRQPDVRRLGAGQRPIAAEHPGAVPGTPWQIGRGRMGITSDVDDEHLKQGVILLAKGLRGVAKLRSPAAT